MVMQTMQIRLTQELINELSLLVDLGMYGSVSEAVRDSVRRLVTGREAPIKALPEKKKVEQVTERLDKEIKKQFQKPKGTVDFFPEELALRSYIFSKLRDIAVKYGYLEIEAPAFEGMDILTAKQGSEIKEQIFSLTKRGSEEFGLRFDVTVSAARMFIEKQKTLQKPVKWFYLARMWRYERPQAGRAREFYQFGTELFGSSKPEADAEIISLVIDSLLALGLNKDDFFVKINNKKLLEGLLLDIVDKDNIGDVIRVIDKRAKISDDEFGDELKKVGLNEKKVSSVKEVINANINELKNKKLNELAQNGLDELLAVFVLLKDKKEFIRVDLSTARGLTYYTGTVFECFDKDEKFRSIAGGGRYDNLIELFKGEKTPATGFGLGYATLSLLLKEKKLLPEIKLGPDYFIAVIGDKAKKKAIEIASKLRKEYVVDVDLTGRGVGKQFKYANAIKAKKVIVIGEDELKSGKLTVKDMDSGKEEKIGVDKIC